MGTGQWALSLIDVDDDEDVVPAVALLPGGPPWLTLSAPVAEQDRHDEPWALPDQRPASIEAPVFAPARPSPLLLDPTRSLAAAPRTTRPTGAAGEPSAAFETERAEVRRLRAELARLAEQMKAFEAERDMTTSRLQELERERAKRGAEVEHLRTRVRNEVRRRERAERGRREPAGSTEEAVGLFVGREDQLRHEVYLAWARRIPAAEKGERPLGDYHVGPAFLDSVAAVAGVERGKVVDVIVEVVTGLAEALPGRDLHQLRTGRGGDDRPVVRACDQATCWRVALQTGTPQARRLHFWRTRQGVELSRVVLHDDMDP